mmetsp:Transcript_44467/g.102773  ORF Transcript_44467/g.102773 Transcript_44467/m.102773 type:complete len:530 (-) Transcript_44467:153-1742(-)
MQPLAYLAVRGLLAWVQFVQRSERAFVNNPLVLVAGGAVHCWAVVYSLFVAVHTRAMRYDGYHEGYIEHLPRSVAWTETLAMASLWVWLLAGFTTAAVRILDDDSGNLPMGMEDVKGGQITKIIRSPLFHSTLGHAHSISCVGLFLSIVMLSITMTSMKGGITACELCLVIISVGFALPHAVLAARRLSEGAERVLADLLPPEAAEAASAEAAALGPQLCIILALADAPGHAYFWQNAVYTVTSVAFLVGIAACARVPPKSTGAALPPEPHESIVCLALDGGAVVAIVLSYPHLNTWLLWLSTIAVFGLAAFAKAPSLREVYEDWLEPVFVVRSDTHKRRLSPQRQFLRRNSWVLCLVCTATALWDIIWHPVAQGAVATPFTNNVLPGPLMLRWQASSSPASQELLSAAAAALGLDASSLQVEKTFPEHRLLLFKYTGPEDAQEAPVSMHWQAAMLAPKGELADLVDSSFPAAFNITMCSQVAKAASGDVGNDTGLSTKGEGRAAYAAACDWWKERFIWQLQNKNSTDV